MRGAQSTECDGVVVCLDSYYVGHVTGTQFSYVPIYFLSSLHLSVPIYKMGTTGPTPQDRAEHLIRLHA